MVAPIVEAAVDQRGLVERAQRGDHDAFAVLAGVTIARLDAAARLILRDPELAAFREEAMAIVASMSFE